MEFNEKLQLFRKQKGLTQEELAVQLYVSRTAISKWESGRGYPSIDSLRAIAKFYGVTLDELLSPDEILTLAEEDGRQRQKIARNMVFGLIDICAVLFVFLPLFALKVDGDIQVASLLSFYAVRPQLGIIYILMVACTAFLGVLTLAMPNCQIKVWIQIKTKASLILSAVVLVVFILGQHPYAAVFAFALLAIKVSMLLTRP